MNIRKDVVIMVAIFVVVIGALVFFASQSSTPATTQQVDTGFLAHDTSHMTGQKNAKVTLVEFGDYQCPACGAAYPITKQILAAYQSNPDFNFVFRNFPLPMHLNAPMAAEAAEAAAEQGKFWEMHDKLYETQNVWSDLPSPLDTFTQYAKDLGLDAAKFKTEVQQNKFASVIQADQADGNAVGLNATPTFYVNGQVIVGVPDLQSLKDLIDAGLKK
jgi:protein-disulfide isomerase